MIGITGASGQLGQGILKLLLDKLPPREIAAITRTLRKLTDFAARGVNVRSGDFEDSAGLAPVFKGIDKLLIIPTSDLRPGARKAQHTAAIKAAVVAGVRHIIYISTVGARPGPDLFDAHFFTETALFVSGKAWTVIRMSLYADNLLATLPQAIKTGTYAAPASAPIAYVSRDDVAAVAAGVMATPGHEGVTYFATGPRAVTPAEIAAGRPTGWRTMWPRPGPSISSAATLPGSQAGPRSRLMRSSRGSGQYCCPGTNANAFRSFTVLTFS